MLSAAAWHAVKSCPAENAASNPETFAVQQIAAGIPFGGMQFAPCRRQPRCSPASFAAEMHTLALPRQAFETIAFAEYIAPF